MIIQSSMPSKEVFPPCLYLHDGRVKTFHYYNSSFFMPFERVTTFHSYPLTKESQPFSITTFWERQSSKRLGVVSNNEVEFEAFIVDLRLCRDKGSRVVDIEGDSQICIRAMICGSIHNWKLSNWVQTARDILLEFEVVTLKHIQRG